MGQEDQETSTKFSPEQEDIEIERKFLVDRLPENLDQYKKQNIKQGYLVLTPDGTEVRLRSMDRKFYQTIKSGSERIRKELEIEISEDQFNKLWPATAGKRIEKTRYRIPYQNLMIELDLYHSHLEGFHAVEIEFKNPDKQINLARLIGLVEI